MVVLAAASSATISGASSGVKEAHAAPLSDCGNPTSTINTGGGSCNAGPVQLSPREQAILTQKQALADEYAAARSGAFNYAQYERNSQAFMAQYGGPTHARSVITPDCVIDPSTGQCATGYGFVSLTQQPQANWYYCGPATAAEILGVRGVNKSQSFLAGNTYLQTDEHTGTNWSGPYVMGPTLNSLTNSSYYVAVNGSGIAGGGFSQTTWQNDMVYDINHGWALAGNIIEYANQDPHLVGHPRNQTILHWIAVYGYDNNGGNTWYADSVHGDSWIWSWAANVPANSSFSSGSMTTLLNQRGFVW